MAMDIAISKITPTAAGRLSSIIPGNISRFFRYSKYTITVIMPILSSDFSSSTTLRMEKIRLKPWMGLILENFGFIVSPVSKKPTCATLTAIPITSATTSIGRRIHKNSSTACATTDAISACSMLPFSSPVWRNECAINSDMPLAIRPPAAKMITNMLVVRTAVFTSELLRT
jgi:hypothetical protein